jgi:CIC family chloride channel protein
VAQKDPRGDASRDHGPGRHVSLGTRQSDCLGAKFDITPPKQTRNAMTAPILAGRGAVRFWAAAILTGVGAGLAAAALTGLLELVQRVVWGGDGLDLLRAASQAAPWRHLTALLGAGLLVGIAQFLLSRLSSANGIEITTAIWFQAGRLPALRTLASATLSVLIVGMGAALGREGAPKQAGAVIANALCDRAVEVLRGALALRFVLPALITTLIATVVSWAFLPDAPTYRIPVYPGSVSSVVWALLAGPLIGLVSVAYVRSVAWADRHRPRARHRLLVPMLALGVLGAVSIPFPQLLGNGREVAELAFTGGLSPWLLMALLLLRPAATMLCLGCGAPGGLFTPSLAAGAMLGGVLGLPWSWLWPGVPPGLFALVGAAAMLAATTQGPISAVVLMMELTGYARAAIVPLLLAVATATLVARVIESRSIYDARLTDDQVAARQRARDHAPVEPAPGA